MCTSSYNDDKILAKEKELKAKVMRRLIDEKSPTSKCKKLWMENVTKTTKESM